MPRSQFSNLYLILIIFSLGVFPPSSAGVELSLPLLDDGWGHEQLHAGTVRINSVFDHNRLGGWYAGDTGNVVVAFTGESADLICGGPAADPDIQGFSQEGGGKFMINGHYTGAGKPGCLYYDGHPAFDFRAAAGTVIHAAAAGMISRPTGPDPVYRNPGKYNTLVIDHGDGWSTWYLHCATHIRTSGGVARGEPIATVGSTGLDKPAPHLHFEVRHNGIPVDPYGWQKIGESDPYREKPSFHLWAEAVKAFDDPRVYLLRRTYSTARNRWETRKWWVHTGVLADDSTFFRDLGYTIGYVKTMTRQELAAYADGPDVLSVRSLYRAPHFASPDVYYVGEDRKSHYVSGDVFRECGFDDGDVYVCDTSAVVAVIQREYYPVGEPLSSCGECLFSLGFSAGRVGSTNPGEGIVPQIAGEVLPGARGSVEADACIISRSAGSGVEGWSLSIEVLGNVDIVAVSTEGTPAEAVPDGRRDNGFEATEIVDPSQNAGRQGAVSAVVLSFTDAVTLDPRGTESVLRLEVALRLPQGLDDIEGEIRFADGLRGSGQPVENALAADGRTQAICERLNVSVVFREPPRTAFHRGDVDDDGRLNITDAIDILRYLFVGTYDASPCMETADANNDGQVNLTDPLVILGFLFLGGPPPMEPGPPSETAPGTPCGVDPDELGSPGDLGCETYRSC